MAIYLNELINCIGQELFDTARFSYTVYGNVAVWIEGHKGIKNFSNAKITFALVGNNIEITGDKLKIRQLTDCCALICGEISTVEVKSG